MGFFDGVKKMAGKVFSKIGEIFDSESIAKIGAKLEDRADATAEIIGTTKSYKPNSSTVSEIDRVNSTLSEFVFSQKDNVKIIEDAFISILDDFAFIVKEVLDDEIICGQFDIRCKDERQTIHNNMANVISKRFSIADTECLGIMKMRPSAKKQNAMKKFADKVQKEAIRETKFKFEISLENMHRWLLDEFKASYQRQNSASQYTIQIVNDFRENITDKQELIKKIDDVISISQDILCQAVGNRYKETSIRNKN